MSIFFKIYLKMDLFTAEVTMTLLVGQLIYTNLPKSGFKLIVSQHIPSEIQNKFVQDIVHQMWDAYNPPPLNYQAVFLQQFSSQRTLFGWLYNDGHDDLGRAHIPYFLGYYLPEKLDEDRLQLILSCLAAGPIYFLERGSLSESLGAVILPEAEEYHSSRPGLVIPNHLQEQLFGNHKKQKLLQLHFACVQARGQSEEITVVDYSEISPIADPDFNAPLSSAATDLNDLTTIRSLTVRSESSLDNNLSPGDLSAIERIFEEVVNEFIGIEGAVLISSEGHPLTEAIGIEKDIALLLAGKMLSFMNVAQTELDWTDFDSMAIHSSEGHLVLSQCFNDFFLLIKTEQMLTGLLEVEIKRIIKKIQAIYESSDLYVSYTSLLVKKEDNDFDSFDDMAILQEEQILYRGRRINR
jgi:predicted regulator of Ras-like GTPase activity (Roadblock/LC7/MglB family)